MAEIQSEIRWAVEQCQAVSERLERLLVEPAPAMTLYSQRDPQWRDIVYAGGKTFGVGGCYVVCVAMIASLAGYEMAPPDVGAVLHRAGAFQGAYLSRPERIPEVFPGLRWDGALDWRQRPADMSRLRREMEEGPVIIEVEFRPGGAEPPADQHFVVAKYFTRDGRDLSIADPWDGTATRLLERYALEHWDLARAIYGARLLKVAS